MKLPAGLPQEPKPRAGSKSTGYFIFEGGQREKSRGSYFLPLGSSDIMLLFQAAGLYDPSAGFSLNSSMRLLIASRDFCM